jgi:hypothetical protein
MQMSNDLGFCALLTCGCVGSPKAWVRPSDTVDILNYNPKNAGHEVGEQIYEIVARVSCLGFRDMSYTKQHPNLYTHQNTLTGLITMTENAICKIVSPQLVILEGGR